MSQKRAKQIRKKIKKLSPEIKTEGLKEFLIYAQKQGFFKRLKFAIKIIFKQLK